jgi:BON domain
MNRRNGRNNALMFMLGAGVGAGLLALLEPGRGARRRALVRDQLVHSQRTAGREINRQARDLGNRVHGFFAERRARWRERRASIPDDQLELRVMAQLGHVLAHANIEVHADNGHVIVSGPVMAGERARIEERLRETRGVRSFDVRVEERSTA